LLDKWNSAIFRGPASDWIAHQPGTGQKRVAVVGHRVRRAIRRDFLRGERCSKPALLPCRIDQVRSATVTGCRLRHRDAHGGLLAGLVSCGLVMVPHLGRSFSGAARKNCTFVGRLAFQAAVGGKVGGEGISAEAFRLHEKPIFNHLSTRRTRKFVIAGTPQQGPKGHRRTGEMGAFVFRPRHGVFWGVHTMMGRTERWGVWGRVPGLVKAKPSKKPSRDLLRVHQSRIVKGLKRFADSPFFDALRSDFTGGDHTGTGPSHASSN